VDSTYVDIITAARVLSVSVKTIRRLVESRQLAHYRVGRAIRIAVVDLDAFMAECRVEPVNVADVVARR
jgi:excisionase family DNA binding protein